MQDKPDADKIKIGDGGKQKGEDGNESSSESYFSSNDEDEDDDEDSSSGSDSDEVSSNSSDSDKQKVPFVVASAQPATNTVTTSMNQLFATHSVNGSINSFNSHSAVSTSSVPQRKPPSTNLRRYTVDEVNEIRSLIEKYPEEEAKLLFGKFRKKFACWNDDTEAYTKFYQKKWRICKEQQAEKNKKRGRNEFDEMMTTQNQQVPPFKKYKADSSNALPPPLINNPQEGISFNASIMPKLPFVETRSNVLKQEKDTFVLGNANMNPLSLPIIPTHQSGAANHPLIASVTSLENVKKTQEMAPVKNEILPPALPPPPGNK